MGRRSKVVTISDDGRDKGKVFILTEMPASKAEKWAARALLALMRAGVDLGEVDENAGMAGLAVAGLQALKALSFEEAEPLMDEMFGCIVIATDPAHPEVQRSLIEDDIEEVLTRVQLRAEVFTLHTGFSFPVVRRT